MQKQALREQVACRAAGLSAEYMASSDAGILQRLVALPEYKAARVIFCYVSVRREPDTRAFIEQALADGKQLCVPRCAAGAVMDACPIEGFAAVQPARFGLLEPKREAAAVAPQAIDLVVAPCVSADRQGHRLGNGAGFYDRYLAQVACPVLCLCREELLSEHVPTGPYDVPVQVLTEAGLYPAQKTGEGL